MSYPPRPPVRPTVRPSTIRAPFAPQQGTPPRMTPSMVTPSVRPRPPICCPSVVSVPRQVRPSMPPMAKLLDYSSDPTYQPMARPASPFAPPVQYPEEIFPPVPADMPENSEGYSSARTCQPARPASPFAPPVQCQEESFPPVPFELATRQRTPSPTPLSPKKRWFFKDRISLSVTPPVEPSQFKDIKENFRFISEAEYETTQPLNMIPPECSCEIECSLIVDSDYTGKYTNYGGFRVYIWNEKTLFYQNRNFKHERTVINLTPKTLQKILELQIILDPLISRAESMGDSGLKLECHDLLKIQNLTEHSIHYQTQWIMTSKNNNFKYSNSNGFICDNNPRQYHLYIINYNSIVEFMQLAPSELDWLKGYLS
jgi:hypothetical protein